MASRREALQLLGLTPDATTAEVRTAFRRKVIEHHPDTAAQGSDDSTVRGLIDAYQLLIEPAPETEPNQPAMRVGESGPGARRVHVKHPSVEKSQPSVRSLPWCQECMATGVQARVVTCPVCGGGSLLTTLDIGQVRVSRCPRCLGRGQMQSLERCRTCEGTGADRSRLIQQEK